jgi:hypothetical protein
MKIKAWNIHLCGPGGDIQPIKATKNALVHLFVDLAGSPFLPKLGQGLTLEALDHDGAM